MPSTAFESGKFWTTPWPCAKGCSHYPDPSNPCGNCWAEALCNRFPEIHGNFKPRFQEAHLSDPLGWRKPRVIFAANTSDLWHFAFEEPEIQRVLSVAAGCPQHQFLWLSKRVDRMCDLFWRRSTILGHPVAPNWWVGATCWNHASAERALVHLAHMPDHHRWICYEPVLGDPGKLDLSCLSWVVLGVETGAKRREGQPEWLRSLADQCDAAGVPWWIKAYPLGGKRITHNLSDMPSWARVRQAPPKLERILRA